MMRLQKSIPSAARDTLGKKGTKFAEKFFQVAHRKTRREKTCQIYHHSYQKLSGEELHKSWLYTSALFGKSDNYRNLGTHILFCGIQQVYKAPRENQVLKASPPQLLQ